MKMDDPFLLSLLENVSDGVYIVDKMRRISFWNSAAEAITGFHRDEVVGSFCMHNILNHVDEAGNKLCLGECPLAAVLDDGEDHEASIYLHHRKGYRVPVNVRVLPLRDDSGEIQGAIEIFMEAAAGEVRSDQGGALEAHTGLMDPVTQLWDSHYVEHFLQDCLEKVRDFSRLPVGIILMEIDNYPRLCRDVDNERCQEVIRTAALSIRGALLPSDMLGRWGESGFLAVTGNTSSARMKSIAERARVLVESSTPLRDTENPLQMTISVGATMVRGDDTVEAVLKRAEDRLYQCKETGGNQICLDGTATITGKK